MLHLKKSDELTVGKQAFNKVIEQNFNCYSRADVYTAHMDPSLHRVEKEKAFEKIIKGFLAVSV